MSTPRQERGLRLVAAALDEILTEVYGKRMGFALLVHAFNEAGIGDYISNGRREDVIATMRENADRLEAREDVPATQGEG